MTVIAVSAHSFWRGSLQLGVADHKAQIRVAWAGRRWRNPLRRGLARPDELSVAGQSNR